MMKDLDKIYDAAFFAEWGKGNADYLESARRIVDYIAETEKPRRIIDAGCGCGIYGHLFKERGIDVVSIDGVIPPAERAFHQDIVLRDLTEPFDNVWGNFDFVLCLEVAEHIPPGDANVFLDNLCRLSSRIVLSAAPPNQGGTHHVNEQPKRYWVKKLAERKFGYDKERSGRLQEHFKASVIPHMWMCLHISFFDFVTDSAPQVLKDRMRTALRS